MALATKRWTDGRIEEAGKLEHPRRLGDPGAAGFDWSKLQFGYSMPGGYKVKITTGDIIKTTYAPVAVAETEVDIGSSDTYVGMQCYRNMTHSSIITSTSKPVPDTTWFKCWFYIFKRAEDGVSLVTVGHLGNVDITGYGD